MTRKTASRLVQRRVKARCSAKVLSSRYSARAAAARTRGLQTQRGRAVTATLLANGAPLRGKPLAAGAAATDFSPPPRRRRAAETKRHTGIMASTDYVGQVQARMESLADGFMARAISLAQADMAVLDEQLEHARKNSAARRARS